MDIFEGDAFSIIELTRALENIPFKPAILSGAALFGSRGVRSRTVMIESRDGTLQLIPFSERGSAFESIRLDQALFSSQFRSALMRALASSMSFRMSAVRATFGGFPALIMA
jgi:hypothetical protein